MRGYIPAMLTVNGRSSAGENGGVCSLGVRKAVSKASGEIFVSNPDSNAILGFAATASGNVAPIQTIAGSATRLADPLGLAVTE